MDEHKLFSSFTPEQLNAVVEFLSKKEKKTKVKGKQLSRAERLDKLRHAILNMQHELASGGYPVLLEQPGIMELRTPPLRDPRTGGWVGHALESLAVYLKRVQIIGNFSQRPPYDHVTDPIYRRLIRDFILGAVMPESKIAALSSSPTKVAESLDQATQFSIIDGLQRLYCFCIALLVVWRREQLVGEGIIPADAWEYFSSAVEQLDAEAYEGKDLTHKPDAVTKLLQRPMRCEVFYGIDLEGLLHYMVTFNTGQRRMSLQVQLEIMRRPLIDALKEAGVPIWQDIESSPGFRAPKDEFAASVLVLATRAFITANPQVTANEEAERFLNENERYTENIGGFDDVAFTFKRITNEIHPLLMQVYADDPAKRYILSAGGTFFVSFAAACGYVRAHGSMEVLNQAIDKVLAELKKPIEDTLNLEEYTSALANITSSRGKSIRRLVYDTFLRFFNGVTSELAWTDTASQISGAVA